MVNPVKAFNRATGLSSITERGQAQQTESVRQAGIDAEAAAKAGAGNPNAPPPTAPPLVGQEPAPQRSSKKARQFAPAILGTASADAGSSGKTLLGQ